MDKPIVMQFNDGMTAREVAAEIVEVANATGRQVMAMVAVVMVADPGEGVDSVIFEVKRVIDNVRVKTEANV